MIFDLRRCVWRVIEANHFPHRLPFYGEQFGTLAYRVVAASHEEVSPATDWLAFIPGLALVDTLPRVTTSSRWPSGSRK